MFSSTLPACWYVPVFTQGPDDLIRDRAAAVLASLPLCGEEGAWTQAAGRVTLEAHGCVELKAPFVSFLNRTRVRQGTVGSDRGVKGYTPYL